MQQRLGRLTCNNDSSRDTRHGVLYDSRDICLPVSFDFGDVQFSFLNQTIDDGRVADCASNDSATFPVITSRARVSKAGFASHIESRTGGKARRSSIPKQRHSTTRTSHPLKVHGQIINDSQNTRPVMAICVELDARASLGKSKAGAIEVDCRLLSNGQDGGT